MALASSYLRTLHGRNSVSARQTRHGIPAPRAPRLAIAAAASATATPTAILSANEEPHIAALRSAADSVLRVADGPMGRGLFTGSGSVTRAGVALLSVPDVNALLVPDPENEPLMTAPAAGAEQQPQQLLHQGQQDMDANPQAAGGPDEPTRSNQPSSFHSPATHACYLRRWQAHHGLRLPAGLVSLLLDSDRLPAPARLALWLMWLRRRCGHASDGGGGGGGGSPAGGSGEAAGARGDVGRADRGLGFWRSYCASLPAPRDVTCVSVFSRREAELLQVPGYKQQWRRTRDSLDWLLELANQAAADDGEDEARRDSPHTWGDPAASQAPQDACAPGGPSRGGGGGGARYSARELRYCYALATSRCFHLPGRMLMAPFADLANHQPLSRAGAYPFWQAAGLRSYDSGANGVTAHGGGAAGGALGKEEAEAEEGSGGWFQFRAVRDLAPGTEVCICYSEGGNAEQLFSYGFVRQANPYDRVDLNPHAPWPSSQDPEDSAWLSGDRLPPGISLCWPAVVAAAGFWAPPPDDATLAAAGGDTDHGGDEASLAAALEQSLLRPRGSAELRLAFGAAAGAAAAAATERTRMQLLRRRAALLSLPYTAADTAALRRSGLGWMASPAEELRRWARSVAAANSGGGGGGGSARERERAALEGQLTAVAALQDLVSEMESEMDTTLVYDEALWAALTALERGSGGGAALAARDSKPAERSRLDGGTAAFASGLLRGLFAGASRTGTPPPLRAAPAAAAGSGEGDGMGYGDAKAYDTPRGRTALLARLEYKRVLAEAADVLAAYRRVVESVL